MKHNILWIVMLLLAVSCLDDKNNYNYKDINNVGDTKITGMRSTYSCFPGESVLVEPKIELSKDKENLANLSYSWYVDGKLMEHTGATYTFTSEQIADHKIVFCATDTKTGVQFAEGATISVQSRWLKGWMLLSKGAGNESQLSVVLMRRSEVLLPKDQTKDTILYDGQDINVMAGLGTGPRGLREAFMVADYDYPGSTPDEIILLQDNKCAELHGNDLHKVINTEDEFTGKVPTGFDPIDAYMTTGVKCVLSKDGYLYTSKGAVITDFHAGRYPSTPAFNNRKFKALYLANRNSAQFVLALDANNTMVGIVDDARTNYGSQDIQMGNKSGALAEILLPNSSDDKTLFVNIPEEVVFTTWTDNQEDYSDPTFVSLLKGNGKYYMHNFSLKYSSNSSQDAPNLNVTASNGRKHIVSSAMMDNYTDIATMYFYKALIVANGNKLYSCSLTEEGDQGVEFKTFDRKIVAIDCKDMGRDEEARYNFGGAHLGVALENGEFYIFEVKYDVENTKVTEMRELYHYEGFGTIVDVMYKYGDNSAIGNPYWVN